MITTSLPSSTVTFPLVPLRAGDPETQPDFPLTPDSAPETQPDFPVPADVDPETQPDSPVQ